MRLENLSHIVYAVILLSADHDATDDKTDSVISVIEVDLAEAV